MRKWLKSKLLSQNFKVFDTSLCLFLSLFIAHKTIWIIFLNRIWIVWINPSVFIIFRIKVLEIVKVSFKGNVQNLALTVSIKYISIFLSSKAAIAIIWIVLRYIFIQHFSYLPRFLILRMAIINKKEFFNYKCLVLIC